MSNSEKKQERFSRIFPNRVDLLRDVLRKVGNCSNRTNYEWEQEKVQQCFNLLADEFIECARRYNCELSFKAQSQTPDQLEESAPQVCVAPDACEATVNIETCGIR